MLKKNILCTDIPVIMIKKNKDKFYIYILSIIKSCNTLKWHKQHAQTGLIP